jgi:hypothetical protein
VNIYLLEGLLDTGYDSYNGFVVIADTEEEARALPGRGGDESDYEQDGLTYWVNPKTSTCTLFGTALAGSEPGIILSDFHAG